MCARVYLVSRFVRFFLLYIEVEHYLDGQPIPFTVWKRILLCRSHYVEIHHQLMRKNSRHSYVMVQ